MNAFARTLLASIVILNGAGTALAQMTFLSQTRSVSAETESGVQSFSNATLLSWTGSASSSYPLGSASASAWQISDLRANRIAMRSYTGGSNMNAYTAIGISTLDVTFRILTATPYEIARDPLSTHGQSSVELTFGATSMFYFSGTTLNGVLEPGVYRLRASLYSQAPWSGPDWASDCHASFIMNVPSPGAAGVLVAGLSIAVGRRRRS
jgi:hypothetical protein